MKFLRPLLAASLMSSVVVSVYYLIHLDYLIETYLTYLKPQYNVLNKASDKDLVLMTSSPVLTTPGETSQAAKNVNKSLQTCPQVLSLGELTSLDRYKPVHKCCLSVS